MIEPKIKHLREIIYEKIDNLIDADYIYIDVPDYNNIGDNLIWEGARDYLQRLKYQCKAEFAYWMLSPQSVFDTELLIFQGGGNFGDLYSSLHQFRIGVIKNNLDKKIIIFPQSIHYKSEDNFQKDMHVLKQHPNLHICVRDSASLELLKKEGLDNVYLVPDMAFCINTEKYHFKNTQQSKLLYMKRNDKEINNEIKVDLSAFGKHVDVSDWPTFNISKNQHRLEYRLERYNKKLSLLLLQSTFTKGLVDSRYGLKCRNQREKYIKTGIAFFEQYDTIITTRLHGLILAVLMNKKVFIVDNNNQKLTRFYDMWLKDFENVEILNLNQHQHLA